MYTIQGGAGGGGRAGQDIERLLGACNRTGTYHDGFELVSSRYHRPTECTRSPYTVSLVAALLLRRQLLCLPEDYLSTARYREGGRNLKAITTKKDPKHEECL